MDCAFRRARDDVPSVHISAVTDILHVTERITFVRRRQTHIDCALYIQPHTYNLRGYAFVVLQTIMRFSLAHRTHARS